jgi:hypothetical protein
MLRFKQLSTNSLSALVAFILLSISITGLAAPKASAETIGVGVGTGRITLDEPIKPSLTYDLPSIAVFNNGDVRSEYEMTVEFNETQPQLKPQANWISFNPKTFMLEPGQAQQVTITINPDYSAVPGEYFAYLEAHPLKRDQSGRAAVQVAAATKFEFKIIPANMFQRVYYALQAFWNKHKPILIPALIALLIIILVLIARRYLKVEIKKPEKSVKMKKPTETSDD